MGTNYEVRYKRMHCKRCMQKISSLEEAIHIGKSSDGWTFNFRAYQGENSLKEHDLPSSLTEIRTVDDWRSLLIYFVEKGAVIYNEYGAAIDINDFWEQVENKKGGKDIHRVDQTYKNDYMDEGCSFTNRPFC